MTEQAQKIFDENVLGMIATVNEDGSPWISPLHMITDGEYIYWFSQEATTHSQNIARDGRISLSLFSTDTSKGPTGVYINGQAERLTGDGDQHARTVAAQRLGSLPSVFDTASAYRARKDYTLSQYRKGDAALRNNPHRRPGYFFKSLIQSRLNGRETCVFKGFHILICKAVTDCINTGFLSRPGVAAGQNR